MPPPEKLSVFISYARKDGSELAHRFKSDLENNGSLVWLDKVRISGGASWTVEIEHGIDESHVFIAITTPGSYVSDICRAEQLRSQDSTPRVSDLKNGQSATHAGNLLGLCLCDGGWYPGGLHISGQHAERVVAGTQTIVVGDKGGRVYSLTLEGIA